jgi:NTP pyrophosphatase (non-canonical NTP hydrolase)
MMDKLTFSELREANLTRCSGYFHPIDAWSPTDWATALAGECGEACNEVKKLRRLECGFQNEKRKEEEIIDAIGKELADTIIYADLLAARLKLDLAEYVRNKFNEVSARVNCNIRLHKECEEEA